MSKPKSRKHVEEYDSDDGFVEDAPKSKKQKVKKEVGSDVQKDDDGNEYWEVRTTIERWQPIEVDAWLDLRQTTPASVTVQGQHIRCYP